MIHFVVPEAGIFSIHNYLGAEGRTLAPRMRALPYESFLRAPALETGTWIFAAIDQLCPAERDIIAQACDTLRAHATDCRALNDPRRVRLRSDLLATMHSAGINRFRAFTSGQLEQPGLRASLCYPVFVREADQHTGNLSPLLHNEAALEAALFSLRLRGLRAPDLLIVEFCDTADAQGVYRKYSAFRVGDAILPRYLNFSTHWMIKHNTRLYDLEWADEELAYLFDNPHEAWLRTVFDLAGIEYGRIDYGMAGDTPQLWEINTNPTIGRAGVRRQRPPDVEAYRNRIAGGRERFYACFTEAWLQLDPAGLAVASPVPFTVPAELLARRLAEGRTRRRLRARRRFYDRLAAFGLVRTARRLFQPALTRLAARTARTPIHPHA